MAAAPATPATLRNWLARIVPAAAYRVQQCRTARSCGVISDWVAAMSVKHGIECEMISVPRHFLNAFPLADGRAVLLDVTALQFRLPHGGSAVDSRDSAELSKILGALDDLASDPFAHVKLELRPALPDGVAPFNPRQDIGLESTERNRAFDGYGPVDLSRLDDFIRSIPTPRENPMPRPVAAIRMFRRFHTRDWRGEGDFHPDLVIPERVALLGPAVHTLYRSDKLNPTDGTDEGVIDYIHEHESGVNVYAPARGAALADVAVPAWIQRCDQLTWLGQSLGFAYRDEGGKKCEAKATAPLPELYCTPGAGRALLVIQSKRRLLAILWGGRLAVERRGIVH